jgi:hypothetical protein
MPQILLLQTSLNSILIQILASEEKEARLLLSVTMQERWELVIFRIWVYFIKQVGACYVFTVPFLQ